MIFGLKKAKPKNGILIVEDNLFMAHLLKDKVKRLGLPSRVAKDGEDAVALIGEALPELVILDTPLPGKVNSFEILNFIRQQYDKTIIPVIMLFGSVDESTTDQAITLGANVVLMKTLTNVEEIVTTAQRVLKDPNFQIDSTVKVQINAGPTGEERAPDQPSETKTRTKVKLNPELLPKVRARVEKVLKMSEAEAPVINLVEDFIEYAYLMRASDIHLEPSRNKVTLRMRIDGILNDAFVLPKEFQPGVITRIKVLANIRTDEHQAAQDGRFRITIKEAGTEFDIRVSIVPTYHGENCVLRLLAEQASVEKISDLTFSAADMEKIKRAVAKPHGMILATGPTGSGKSTTLYTILKEISTRAISIITIEDPIEYSVDGVDQIQVNNHANLTFANGLRSILRQDPNVIMVGEIRDEETASIAVNAALTGHKLLSTLHTNDAATTLPRLLDMGVEPFLVASTINIAIGQRLVRILCEDCKEKKVLTETEYEGLLKHVSADVLKGNKTVYQAKGCEACGQTGYKGRMGIYEVLEVNDFIRDAIIQHADASEIRKIAVKNGMTILIEDGFQKVLDGKTTIEEILRVVRE